jgi:hypothetical protein
MDEKRIGFVVARVGEERNVVQKLALLFADELNKLGLLVEIVRFSKLRMLNPFWRWKLSKYKMIFIANVGLQCAYFCLLKRLHIIKHPILAFSFGSDIREFNNVFINFFNWVCAPAIDILVPVNPDLVPIAEKRGYKYVRYLPNWAGDLA